MSDLYSLVRRSIVERGLTSSAAREEVYQQARTAVIRELWSYEPSVGEEEIEARMAQFDRAIDQLESKLAATFAEPPELPPARPHPASPNGAVSVFEGYDQDTDYVPGYLDRRPRRSVAAPPAQPRPSRTPAAKSHDNSGGLDPLALRSAAIEAALRSSGDDLAYEEGEEPAEPPVEAAEADDVAFHGEERFDEAPEAEVDYAPPAGRSWDGDYPGEVWDESERTERRVPLAAHAEDEFPFSDDSAPVEARPAKRRGLALPALSTNLSERTRIRVLIGAIVSLGVVLIALAAVILTPLLAPSGGTPPPAATGAAPTESGGETASPGDVVQTFTVFDGGDPTVFESGSGNPVRFDKAAGFARISSSTSDPGVRVVVGPGLAGRIAGRPVRITVVARSSQDNGAAGLRFAYENGLAISHWQTAHLNTDFASYDLVWRIPAMHADPGTDQLLIEPGIPGDGTAADIQLIKIDVLKAEP